MATFAVLVGALAAGSSGSSAGTTTPTGDLRTPTAAPGATVASPDASTTGDGFGPGGGRPFEQHRDRHTRDGEAGPSDVEPWNATPSAPDADADAADPDAVEGGTATTPAAPTTSSHGS